MLMSTWKLMGFGRTCIGKAIPGLDVFGGGAGDLACDASGLSSEGHVRRDRAACNKSKGSVG